MSFGMPPETHEVSSKATFTHELVRYTSAKYRETMAYKTFKQFT